MNTQNINTRPVDQFVNLMAQRAIEAGILSLRNEDIPTVWDRKAIEVAKYDLQLDRQSAEQWSDDPTELEVYDKGSSFLSLLDQVCYWGYLPDRAQFERLQALGVLKAEEVNELLRSRPYSNYYMHVGWPQTAFSPAELHAAGLEHIVFRNPFNGDKEAKVPLAQ